MMCRMGWNRKRRDFLKHFERKLEDHLARYPEHTDTSNQRSGLSFAMTAAWATGAVAVIAAGLYAGRELRTRYKLKRRTPYDYYAHSGDRSDLEFGVGI